MCQVGHAALPPILAAVWLYGAPTNLLYSRRGCSWRSWVMKCVRTIAPVWVKYKMFLLHLSLVVDAEIRAVNRMDEVIHPRPYAPSF